MAPARTYRLSREGSQVELAPAVCPAPDAGRSSGSRALRTKPAFYFPPLPSPEGPVPDAGFVLAYRCGAAPDFDRVPFSATERVPSSTNTRRNVLWCSASVNQDIGVMERQPVRPTGRPTGVCTAHLRVSDGLGVRRREVMHGEQLVGLTRTGVLRVATHCVEYDRGARGSLQVSAGVCSGSAECDSRRPAT